MTQTGEQMEEAVKTCSSELHGYTLSIVQALALPFRQRVLAYVTRGQQDLLVFEHTPEYPDAGIRVPAGGVECGEGPEQAAVRELFEETGLRLRDPVHLVSAHWTRADRCTTTGCERLWTPPTVGLIRSLVEQTTRA